MKREIIKTGDGSTTIHLPEWGESYHSKHGAIAEALHVFIDKGFSFQLDHIPGEGLNILEIGFGTGLNAYLTLMESVKRNVSVQYKGVEAYPVDREELDHLNYKDAFSGEGSEDVFQRLHDAPWNELCQITSSFSLYKQQAFFKDIEDQEVFDLIYFDAFGPRVQPELWTEAIFEKMYSALKPGGCLVTYSAKGSVRRAMQSVGFEVERLPGPPGKREMLRALKNA